MKKFCVAVIIFCVMIFSAKVFAGVPIVRIQHLIGTWYDSHGNQTLTISKDYSINGCKILDVENNEGYYGTVIYELIIMEQTGIRKMKLVHCLQGEDLLQKKSPKEDFHEHIVIDEKYSYRRNQNQQYIESVGGIYLGMSESDVLKLYGKPSSTENKFWKYDNEGFAIDFHGDIVEAITLYKNGNKKLDRSGLSANFPIASFRKAYGMTEFEHIRGKKICIGGGEIIYFIGRDGDGITLQ